MEERVGYELKRAQHALRLAMDETLREIGLTTPQYAALAMLEEEGGISGAELARRAFVTPQTMNTIVANLETRQLVDRSAHPSHGRILETRLTEHGRSLLSQGHERVRAIERRTVAHLSERDRRALLRMLRAYGDALQPHSASGAGSRRERPHPTSEFTGR